MLLNLPLELFYEIFSNLTKYPCALKFCALACKTLSVPAQTFLFSRVEIRLHISTIALQMGDTRRRASRESRLLNILEEKPVLIRHIHDVVLHDLFDSDDVITAVAEEPQEHQVGVPSSFASNSEALYLLGLLKHVKNLRLYAQCGRSWKHLNPEVEKSILKAFQYPRITNVEVHAMSSFPVALFEGCLKNLRHLSISTFPFLRLDFDDAPLGRALDSTTYLDSLCLSTSTLNLERLIDWVSGSRFNLTRLRKLVIRSLGDDQKDVQSMVWNLASGCAPTLQELEFFAYLPYGRTNLTSPETLALYDIVDLGTLRALKKLTIRYWLSDFSDSNRQLTLLARLLQTMDRALDLEELVLHFVVIHSRAPQDRSSYSSWEVLDRAIVENGPPVLQKVVIRFESVPESQRYEMIEKVKAGLSKINARRILDVQPLSSSARFIPFFR